MNASNRLAIFVLAALVRAISGSAAHAQSVETVGWMAGCWELRAGGLLVEEQWNAPRAGTMLGTSRTSRDGRISGFEFVRLFESDEGLVYEASPSGQATAQFTASKAGPAEAVFENPAHDYPQRVIYRPVGRDSLMARVEGTTPNGPRGSDFPYARVDCPAGE